MRRACASAVAGLLASLLLAPAAVAGTLDQARITVSAGYEQRYVAGKGVPVSVILEATRSLAGHLELSSVAPDGSVLVRSLRVEVPSGGRKQFDLAIPAAGLPSPRLQATFRDGTEVLASSTVDLIPARNELLIGVMAPTIPQGLAGHRVAPTNKEVRAALLPDAWVALGKRALEPLAYVLADSDRIKALAPEARSGLFDWVAAGGRLLIAARDPNDLDWLPDGWRSEWTRDQDRWIPDPGRGAFRNGLLFVRAGLGQVFVSPAPLTEGSDIAPFTSALLPAPGGISTRPEFAPEPVDFDLLNAIGSSDGSGVNLRWLMAFLLAYVVLAGPVNYLVLRRLGRKELAWVTVPLLALVFSGVAYGLVREVRGGLAVRQANLVFATAEAQSSKRIVTVSSGSGGERRIEFDSKDTAQPWGGFERAAGARRLTVEQTASGAVAVLNTSPFSVGVAESSLSQRPGYLDGTLVWNGGGLSGRVTNRTALELDVVARIPGREDTRVGTLAPGASADVTLDDARPPRRRIPFFGMGFRSEEDRQRRLRMAMERALQSSLGWDVSFGTPLLFGYAPDFRPPLKVDGQTARPPGPLLIASPMRTQVAGDARGRLPAHAGSSNLVAIDGSIYSDSTSLSLQDYREAVFSYRLPEGLERDRVTSAKLETGADGPAAFRVDYFDFVQNRWIQNRMNIGSSSLTLTPSAVSEGGELYVRLSPQLEPFMELWYLGMEVAVG